MTKKKLLFDTYAILEIINGKESYKEYLDSEFTINEFIFAELCYKLAREKVPNYKKYLAMYAPYVVYPTPEAVEEAMLFRTDNIKKNLSMTDCISYIMSKRLKLKFLTGDKEFENMPNVEFVK
ncbi:PIN domain-containing protein [Candidatus Woesearchaeota archaeon]|nr:PIN domain-containing protein [Candidatus Woesearchaeota archaeon]